MPRPEATPHPGRPLADHAPSSRFRLTGRLGCVASLLLMVAPTHLAAAGAPTAPPADTLTRVRKEALTDSIFAEAFGPRSPGCAVGVVHAGELVFSRGYGLGNLEHGAPFDARSSFYLASVSKQFIGAAVGLLVLDGTVGLDDDVRTWIPELPDYGHRVTVRHLLHHTSGVRDYLTLYSIAGRSFQDFFDNDDAIELIAGQKALNFEPGSEHLYSNSGYVLLAEIVERATEQTLDAFSRERIFGPLGMKGTHWGEDVSRVVPGRADSYEMRDDTPHRFIWNFHAKGDGNLHSTVEDLARWDGMFYRTDPPWPALVELMLTPGVLNDGEKLHYALGLAHGSYQDRPTVSHSGGMLGYRTHMMRFPEDRFTAIVLCNLASANPGQLGRRLADVWLLEEDGPPSHPTGAQDEEEPPESPEPPAWSPSVRELERYVGTYRSEELDATQVITLEGSSLIATRGGEDEGSELVPEEPGRFTRGEGARWTFQEQDGTVTGFTLDVGRVRGLVFLRRDR